MIELKKARLPEAVTVDGDLFFVRTSFKYWLRFLELLEDKKTPLDAFDFMYIDKIPESRLNGVMALIKFCNPPQVLPRTQRDDFKPGEKACDFTIDADYIFAAFLEQYGIDLVESDMHWHKFQALFKGLHDTKLNDIIGYRMWENTDGKKTAYSRHMEKLRAAWELPENDGENDEDLKAFEAQLK